MGERNAVRAVVAVTIQREAMARERRRRAVLPRVKFLLLAVVMLASCDTTVYHRFAPVMGESWAAGDTLSFLYEGSGRVPGNAAVEVQFRYAAGYKYKNLCVRVETLSAAGEQLSADTLCCVMYDDDGRRLGSTAGAVYQNRSTAVAVPASCADTLLFKVSHVMDEEVLAGIFDVGLRITAIEE